LVVVRARKQPGSRDSIQTQAVIVRSMGFLYKKGIVERTLIRMRIGFDCSVLTHPHPAGVARVAHETLAELERRGVLEVVRLMPPANAPLRSWRQLQLPKLARGLRGLHSFVSAFPLFARVPIVATIHELPWRFGEQENSDLRHRFWALAGPLRAASVIVPSATTRAGLAWAGTRVRQVPWGVAGCFFEDPRTARELRVLVPGGTRPKKRADALLPALAKLGGWTLAISGPVTQWSEELRARAVQQQVPLDVLGELPDEALAVQYRRASAVALLARSEGFGLPALEALASGTHVLVTLRSAQAEVSGELGLRIVVEDLPSLCAALKRCAGERQSAGPAHAARFTWEHTAQHIEAIWREHAR
jgi:glycosyltransferase involved in cell wall biosynthesis